MKRCSSAVVALLLIWIATPLVARGEEFVVGTYNLENFRLHFLGHALSTTKPKVLDTDSEFGKEISEYLKSQNDEDNWETSQVILDPKFAPDVLVFQEGASQKDMEYFNHRWLQDAYETVIVFDTNTTRGQNTGILLKKGFDVVDRKDKYFLEPDTVTNDRGERLFARGPAFVLVQTPGGYRLWVGTNHQKSKSGNSAEVTAWRNREAVRTHQIIKDIAKQGPDDVIFLGDMNDELGIQQYELESGGDTVANLVGPQSDGFILATRPAIDAGERSYNGYFKTRFRSFIDQIIVTPSMKDQLGDVHVFQNEFTQVASDHFPVMIHIKSDEPPAAPGTGGATTRQGMRP